MLFLFCFCIKILLNWQKGLENWSFFCLYLKNSEQFAAAKSLQSCPTLCDPIDGSPPVFLVPGILQARTLEWVAISFSNAWKWKVKVKLLSQSCPTLATPWTAAHQAPPSMGFSRQKYWSGVPLPSPLNSLSMSFLFFFSNIKYEVWHIEYIQEICFHW